MLAQFLRPLSLRFSAAGRSDFRHVPHRVPDHKVIALTASATRTNVLKALFPIMERIKQCVRKVCVDARHRRAKDPFSP